jgi:hypothetical protein
LGNKFRGSAKKIEMNGMTKIGEKNTVSIRAVMKARLSVHSIL